RRRIGRDASLMLIPIQRAGARQCRTDIEPQGVISGALPARFPFRRAQAAANAGIRRTHISLRRAAGPRDLGLDLATCAKAGIEQPHRVELRQRRAVIVEMLGLTADRPIPIEPEPAQILEDRLGVFRAAARVVDVLDAEQKAPARFARRAPSLQCRTHMAEMQIPGRAWRKPRDYAVSAHASPPAAADDSRAADRVCLAIILSSFRSRRRCWAS